MDDRQTGKRSEYLRLRPGDVIRVHAAGPQLINIKLHDILAPAKTTGEPLALTVMRDGAYRAVVPLRLKLSPRYEIEQSVGGLSRSERLQLAVPEGMHSFEITLEARTRSGVALKVLRGKKSRPADLIRLVRIPGVPAAADLAVMLPLQPVPGSMPAAAPPPAGEPPAGSSAASDTPPAPPVDPDSRAPASSDPLEPTVLPTPAQSEMPEISTAPPVVRDEAPAYQPSQISGAAAPSRLRRKEPSGRVGLGVKGDLVIPATQADLGLSYGVLLVLRYHLPALDGDLAVGLEAGYSPARAAIRFSLGAGSAAGSARAAMNGHSVPVLIGLYYDLPLDLPVEIGLEAGYAMAWARLELRALGETLEVEGTVHGYFAGGGLDLPLGPGRLGVAARWVSTPGGTGDLGGLELGGVHVNLGYRFLF